MLGMSRRPYLTFIVAFGAVLAALAPARATDEIQVYNAEIAAELVQRVRDQLGAVAALRQVDVVAALPKTRSGKVLRKNMRAIADGLDIAVPSTIDNPAVLDDLRGILKRD